MRMVWLPVRCCCTPTKVFGFLPLPERDVEHGEAWLDGQRLEIREFCRRSEVPPVVERREAMLSLNFAKLMTTERAVYSDDRPRAFWRSMPGFLELPET